MFASIRRHPPESATTMKVPEKNMAELAARPDVMNMFRRFDANGDDAIDRNELGDALTSVDKSWTPDRIDRLFRVIDMNSDGLIDYNEFLTWVFATPKIDTKDLRAFRDAAKKLSACASPSVRLVKEKPLPAPLGPKVEASGLAINTAQLPHLGTHMSLDLGTSEPTNEICAPPTTLVPAKLINIRVMSMIGNEVGTIDGIDTATTTGHSLKTNISTRYGFPSFNMKLLLPTGGLIKDGLLSTQACFCEVAETCGYDYLPVSCVLSTAQPFGPKEKGKKLQSFGSKAGMLLEHRIESREAGLVSILKVADPSLRADAQRLLTESFAPHLVSLIDTGFRAAYRPEVLDTSMEDGPMGASEAFTYLDSENKSSADLSSCRLWVGMLEQTALDADPWVANMWREECSCRNSSFGNLVSAVLWRLIFGWEGGEGAARAGPILEVLFLATHPNMREGGQARKLVKELENGAMAMGCSAIVVAAVPSQGIKFWKRCGYEVSVPLGDEGLGQAVSTLGEFLLENMLLFTDCPLVAKALI